MYTEKFASLKQAHSLKNFEVVAKTLDVYFNDLFNLEVLDNEAKHGCRKGSYVEWFNLIMPKLDDLWTEKEVCAKVYDLLLNDMNVRRAYLSKPVFVPPINDVPSKQLGFLEKVATGELKVAEPVTLIDMLRLGCYLPRFKNRSYGNSVSEQDLMNRDVTAFHLHSMTAESISSQLVGRKSILVNCNLDKKQAAKWVVVDLANHSNPRYYCETPLFEEEKKALEERFGMKLAEVSPGKANSLASTGYMAIAWLDEVTTKAWTFKTSADFSATFGDYVFAQFSGDGGGIKFEIAMDEYNRYFTPELRRINRSGTYFGGSSDSAKWGGFELIKLVTFHNLGKVNGVTIPWSDLSATIRALALRDDTLGQITNLYQEAYRSLIPGFARTLTQLEDNYHDKVLQQNETEVNLRVMRNINWDTLRSTHVASCTSTNTEPSHLSRCISPAVRKMDQGYGYSENIWNNQEVQNDMAATMVLTLFRSFAKKSKIGISLPSHFSLSDAQIDWVVNLMENNAYVTELFIGDNESLQKLHARLVPVLARNRLLKENGYLPPMVDNYWARAAKYWLLHLNEQNDILEDKNQHIPFKRNVKEMGVKGLRSVLSMLRDESERNVLEEIYGRNRPAFFAAARRDEMREYIAELIRHFNQKAYFPFSEFGIAYEPGCQMHYVDLFSGINRLGKFEQVVLTDVLSQPKELNELIVAMAKKAREEKWTALVVIPELEDKSKKDGKNNSIFAAYALLNDVILRNRHVVSARTVLNDIRSASDFDDRYRSKIPAAKITQENHDDNDEDVDDKLALVPFAAAGDDDAMPDVFQDKAQGPWPLQRGGAVQLQLQQQQQIEQNRQVQQQQEKMQMRVLESALPPVLVTYQNIDQVMGAQFAEFKKENPVTVESALLKTDSESELQGFFHTWINANPVNKAENVIHAMTPDAAKVLIQHHMRIPSGLSLNNLPKGFYTQRNKDGQLILCYNPEVGYMNTINAFTQVLPIKKPAAEQWEGDFRLFDIDKYLANPRLAEDDLELLMLFAKLQPKTDYTQEYQEFMRSNPNVANILKGENINQIKEWKWIVLWQCWQLAGEQGVRLFLQLDKQKKIVMTAKRTMELLLRHQSAETKAWADKGMVHESVIRALAQVYYRYGDDGLSLLLAKFRQIHNALGDEFFVRFNQDVISRSTSYDVFVTERFFIAMDDMMVKLSAKKSAGLKQLWLDISSKHYKVVPWENVETLWRAFEFFAQEIEKQGVVLKGDEFANVAPENMMVCMDRILTSMQLIASQERKSIFMRRLGDMQLTHGGVHYAVQYEKFAAVDEALHLHDFHKGNPTYAPLLKSIYTWNASDAGLYTQRVLASRSKFSEQGRQYLSQRLASGDLTSRHLLVLALFTQYDEGKVDVVIEEMSRLQHLDVIAKHIHVAATEYGQVNLSISHAALQKLSSDHQLMDTIRVLNQYQYGTVLEAITILHNANRWADLSQLLGLFSQASPAAGNSNDFLYRESFKLATLFGQYTPQAQQALAQLISGPGVKPLAREQLRLLIDQLQSIDHEKSKPNVINSKASWDALLKSVALIKGDLANCSDHRIAFVDQMIASGVKFKYSRSGAFRALLDVDEDRPEELNAFVDHKPRLWKFLRAHIVVPINQNAPDSLRPIMLFFKSLQLNRTYLNEVEPLLAILEKTAAGKVWTAAYFAEMLALLQPEDAKVSYPISLVEVMLKDVKFAAREVDQVSVDFPTDLVKPIKAILKNTIFDREQQALLCELVLKEFDWQQATPLLAKTIDLLGVEHRDESRLPALKVLVSSSNQLELQSRFDTAQWLLEQAVPAEILASWPRTTSVWLQAVADKPLAYELLQKVKGKFTDAEADKRSAILHIIAWSALHVGLRDNQTHEYVLTRKSEKLLNVLTSMPLTDLQRLASCYPSEPAPSAEDVLRMTKNPAERHLFAERLQAFLRHPHAVPRHDYQQLAITREADLKRMLSDTRITRHGNQVALEPDMMLKLSFSFAVLKQLESGDAFVLGANKAITEMDKAELAAAFARTTKALALDPTNTNLNVEVWALQFEALGRTTGKYPHLAQQFSLIANDICVDSKTTVLQLATGEGKSHFVAMRAARHAGMGKVVDVCTAKLSLAKRDVADYKELYNYLGLTSSYIHAKSSRESYVDTQIHYTTAGDLSLFLDEQSFNGVPILLDLEERIALFDEFDFIRFEEGCKTEYNYARPTGQTPKQMKWFYQATNDYYQKAFLADGQEVEADTKITKDHIRAYSGYLIEQAGEDEDRQLMVERLAQDPLQLVRWLQSAHEAKHLEKGVHFTIRDEHIQVGETTYPMREVIPLSSDNQVMHGSTFSAGVQQLVAVLLNNEARLTEPEEPQNFHIHPESNIISSQVAAQRMQVLWSGWEGFTGTISASQASILDKEQGTQVLHVPTNQRSQRVWEKPKFYDNAESRMQDIIADIKACQKRQRSILFPCKNDAKVLEFKRELDVRMTAAEVNQHFVVYTNDQPETSAEILAVKSKMEAVRGGKKTQSAHLIASGFGRGDNPDVEDVVMMDVTSVNDLLQKGGRTGRNGSAGNVRQYYVRTELKQEETKLLAAAAAHTGVTVDQMRHSLVVEGANEDEKSLQRVMLLGEYVFHLQNASNLGYHAGLAQFSDWTMSLIGQVEDPLLRSEFIGRVGAAMKSIEKRWVDISGNPLTSAEEKVREVEAVISKTADSFLRDNAKTMQEKIKLEAFTLQVYPAIRMEMKPEPKVVIDEKAELLAQLSVIIAHLSAGDLSPGSQAELTGLVRIFAQAENEAISFFMQRLLDGHCESIDVLMSDLRSICSQVEAGDESVVRKVKARNLRDDIDPIRCLDGVDEVKKATFIQLMSQLNHAVAEALLRRLSSRSLLALDARVDNGIVLMRYLLNFTNAEQLTWGNEYAHHVDVFPVLIHERVLKQRMSFSHMKAISALVMAHTNEANREATCDQVMLAMSSDVEMRIRLFTKWEALVAKANLSAPVSGDFLKDFSNVMTKMLSDNGDIFSKLMSKSQHGWRSRSADLRQIWANLSANADQLPAVAKALRTAANVHGSISIDFLLAFTSLPIADQVTMQDNYIALFQEFSKSNKRNKRQQFKVRALAMVKAKRPLSAERLASIMATVDSTEIIDLINYDIQLPAIAKSDRIYQDAEESLTHFVIRKAHENKLHELIPDADIRAACLLQLNGVFAKYNPANIDEMRAYIAKVLQQYAITLQKMQSEKSNLPANWYVGMLTQYPETMIQDMRLWAGSAIALADLASELRDGRFSAIEVERLLKIIGEKDLSKRDLSVITHQLESVDTVLQAFDESTRNVLRHKLLNLPTDMMLTVLLSATQHIEVLQAKPMLLTMILNHANTRGMTAARLTNLSDVISSIAKSSGYSDEQLAGYDFALTQFDQKHKSSADLLELHNLLHVNGMNVAQVLYDDVAHYFRQYVAPEHHAAARRIAEHFYRRAIAEQGRPEKMFNLQEDAMLRDMFDFNHQSPFVREDRIIWMHALNHQAFVTDAKNDAHMKHHEYQFTQRQNQQLLQLGLNEYSARAKAIFENHPKGKLGDSRQLTVQQQRQLLSLSDELAVIGKATLSGMPAGRIESENELTAMKDDCKKILGRYQSSFFKSQLRKNQIRALQNDVENVYIHRRGNSHSYAEIFKLISEARLQAIRQDRSNFKTHRHGSSRYLNTLNQLQDMVAKHWAQDAATVNTFQDYAKLSLIEIQGLSKEFKLNLTAQATRESDLVFQTKSKYRKFKHIRQETYLFDLAEKTEAFEKLDNKSAEDIAKLMQDINESMPKLPGNLRAVANELLVRCEALSQFQASARADTVKQMVRTA